MTRWVIAVLAVAGAFLVGGIGGAVASGAAGVWYMLGAGFLAALSVVSVAYIAAPAGKLQFSALCFALGVVSAWILVGNEYYPESYGERAYQPTLLPFAATCIGGMLGLVIVGIFDVWKRLRVA